MDSHPEFQLDMSPAGSPMASPGADPNRRDDACDAIAHTLNSASVHACCPRSARTEHALRCYRAACRSTHRPANQGRLVAGSSDTVVCLSLFRPSIGIMSFSGEIFDGTSVNLGEGKAYGKLKR